MKQVVEAREILHRITVELEKLPEVRGIIVNNAQTAEEMELFRKLTEVQKNIEVLL